MNSEVSVGVAVDSHDGGRTPSASLRRAALRVLMAAGGTGGHIFPALAVAEELRDRYASGPHGGNELVIQFLGTGRELERRLIPAAGFTLRTVSAAGLKGIGGWRKVKNLAVLPVTAVQTALALHEFQPHVVVGVGGYAAGPAMLEAALQDIPTLLIEPNATPGFTNRVLAPLISCAAVAFEETLPFYGPKGRLTGQPVRRFFRAVRAKRHEPPFTVLILGGSQGAAAINQCVSASLCHLAPRASDLRFIHQTGERDLQAVAQAYARHGLTAEVYPFIENVADALAGVDLVISRSGATAVAELTVAGKASLLIPFPAADNHQFANALVLQRAGAARINEQKELTPTRLAQELGTLLADPKQLCEMEEKARKLARPDAAERVADLIEELARFAAD